METIEFLAKLIWIVAYLGTGIWWWVTWMGMHNNTIDGNSYRLIYPFAVFDKSQFTETGNRYRISHIKAAVAVVALSVPYLISLGQG